MTTLVCSCGRDLATHPPGACLDALAWEFVTGIYCYPALPFKPGEDWRDAGRILEAAVARDAWPLCAWVQDGVKGHGQTWECSMTPGPSGEALFACADTAPLAITRAAAMCVVAEREKA